jgi:Holliday junction resolvasome RuvABC endonuclease subunit
VARTIIIGLDPGTGVSSGTGFGAFDPDTREILHVEEITSKKKASHARIREISERLRDILSAIDPDAAVEVYLERFVMRGRSGEVLARLSGGLLACIPERCGVGEVQNTTVKRVVGGHGTADKVQVAKGVHDYLGSQPELEQAIQDEAWDVTDALAIGIAGYLLSKSSKTTTT